MKRTMSVSVEDETAQCSKKRVVTYRTFQKWQRDFDKEFSTMSWLDCEARMNGGNKIPYSGLISGVKIFVKSAIWPSEVIFVV